VTLSLIVIVSCGSASLPTPTSSLTPATPPTVTQTPTQTWGTNGTISKIDDNTLILTTAQGQVELNINSDIIIQKTMNGTLSDFRQGQFVSVIGSLDANGDINATSILIRLPGQSAPPTPPSGAAPSPGRAPRQRQGANGTITNIGGNTLTLNTERGPVKVKIGSDTTILRSTTGTISDLRVGEALSVIGSQDANGNITATSIHIRPQS
jgi:RNase P/RNase MRP subunit p29